MKKTKVMFHNWETNKYTGNKSSRAQRGWANLAVKQFSYNLFKLSANIKLLKTGSRNLSGWFGV